MCAFKFGRNGTGCGACTSHCSTCGIAGAGDCDAGECDSLPHFCFTMSDTVQTESYIGHTYVVLWELVFCITSFFGLMFNVANVTCVAAGLLKSIKSLLHGRCWQCFEPRIDAIHMTKEIAHPVDHFALPAMQQVLANVTRVKASVNQNISISLVPSTATLLEGYTTRL